MSWPAFWPVLGVVTVVCLLLAPVLYVLMRRELRKAFKPMLEDLQGIDQELKRLHGRFRDAGWCVHEQTPAEGGRSWP